MRPSFAIAVLLALVAACSRVSVHDASHFHGAKLLDDGRTGFVSYTYGRYRLVGPDPIFGGGRATWLEDVKILARLDTTSGAVDVVLRDEHPRGGNGTGNWTIHETCERIALVYRARRTSHDGPEIEAAYALIDVDTGQMRPLEPEYELLAWRATPRHAPRLLDGRGTLLYEAHGVDEPSPRANRTLDLFLRRASGAIEELGHGRYELHGDGALYYWIEGDRDRTRYDLASGEWRTVSNREFADASAALRARATLELRMTNDKERLELARKEAGAWVRQPVPADFDALR